MSFTNKIIIGIISFLALSTVFTGCSGSYDDEIDDLQKQIDDMSTILSSGYYIKSYENVTGGFRITLSNDQTYTITNGETGATGATGATGSQGATGAAGAAGTSWSITEDGYWVSTNVVNNVSVLDTTDILATGKSPYPGSTGFWIVYEWDPATSAYVTDTTNIPTSGGNEDYPYIVDKGTEVEIYMLQLINGVITKPTAPITIQKTSGTSAAATIELLGFTQLSSLSANISLSTLDTSTLVIKKETISKIVDFTTGRDTTWNEGRYVLGDGVNEILLSGGGYAIMRYDGGDPSGMTVDLQNSRGVSMPITFGEVQPYRGLLTKAASDGGLYAIPITNIESTFTDGLSYRLVTSLGKSNYSKSSIRFSTGNTISPVSVDKFVSSTGSNITVTSGSPGSATIVSERYYSVSFDSANTGDVYDYYVRLVAPNANAGFTFHQYEGTFVFDNAGTYNIYVYKLHLDGIIYREEIAVTVI